MLPKIHALLGIIFIVPVYFIFHLNILEISIIFLASVLIDFDHYLWYIQKFNDYSLKKAYNLLKGNKKNNQQFMLFHTIEFMILIAFLSYISWFFALVLVGMLFHSICDIIYLINRKALHYREFSFFRYLYIKRKNPNHYY